MSKYFKISEFKCPCCMENEVSLDLVAKLNEAREISGIPYVVTSGYRCAKHNEAVGGKPNSSHRRGLAVDIAAPDSHSRYKILEGVVKAGFKRVGIANGFIHVDIDDTLPPEVSWLYS